MNESLIVFSSLLERPLLTAEQEHDLAIRARAGSLEARNLLVESNIRLLKTIAMRYVGLLPLEELVEEGAKGLIRAADKFDPRLGWKFSTYATHGIRGAISRAVSLARDGRYGIRYPARVGRKLRELEKLLDHDPNLACEMAVAAITMGAHLDSAQLLLLLRQQDQHPLSLDAHVGDTDVLVGEVIPVPESYDRDGVSISLDWALDLLDPREAQAIRLFYLEELSYDEIAPLVGVTSPRTVARICRRGLDKLRLLLKSELYPYELNS